MFFRAVSRHNLKTCAYIGLGLLNLNTHPKILQGYTKCSPLGEMFVCDSRNVAYQNSTNGGDVNAGHDEPSRSTRLITAAITRVKRTVCRDPPLRWRPLQRCWQTLKSNKSTPIRFPFLSLSYSLLKKVVQFNVLNVIISSSDCCKPQTEQDNNVR